MNDLIFIDRFKFTGTHIVFDKFPKSIVVEDDSGEYVSIDISSMVDKILLFDHDMGIVKNTLIPDLLDKLKKYVKKYLANKYSNKTGNKISINELCFLLDIFFNQYWFKNFISKGFEFSYEEEE